MLSDGWTLHLKSTYFFLDISNPSQFVPADRLVSQNLTPLKFFRARLLSGPLVVNVWCHSCRGLICCQNCTKTPSLLLRFILFNEELWVLRKAGTMMSLLLKPGSDSHHSACQVHTNGHSCLHSAAAVTAAWTPDSHVWGSATLSALTASAIKDTQQSAASHWATRWLREDGACVFFPPNSSALTVRAVELEL